MREGCELRRSLHRLGLDDGQREAVEALTRAIVNKILHAPLSNLRAETDREESLAMLEAARSLFSLDDPRAPGATRTRSCATSCCASAWRPRASAIPRTSARARIRGPAFGDGEDTRAAFPAIGEDTRAFGPA